jgi:hypothetical protein
MTADEIKEVVQEVLAEQKLLAPKDIDDAVLKTIATILTSFGIEEEDRKDATLSPRRGPPRHQAPRP